MITAKINGYKLITVKIVKNKYINIYKTEIYKGNNLVECFIEDSAKDSMLNAELYIGCNIVV